MENGCFALLIEAVQHRHRAVEGKEPVELEACTGAVLGHRELAAQTLVVGIANGGRERQSIERTAQDDREEARITRSSDGEARQQAPHCEAGGADHQMAAGQKGVLAAAVT